MKSDQTSQGTNIFFLYSDIEITEIPPAMIPVELQVIVPGTYEVLTEVQIGRNMALRIIFDNKAINSKPCFIGNSNRLCFAKAYVQFQQTTVSVI